MPRSRSPSYLDAATLAVTAAAGGAEALHPGYGFLSESPELAEACRAAGLVFVGPPPEALATLGRKDAARELAQRAGVPVVPGGADAAESATRCSSRRAPGGGGRGMRVVREPRRARGAVGGRRGARPARRSATAGSSTSATSRAPGTSRCRSCATRTAPACTSASATARVQRRHQKVIEEAPAPGVGRELRGELGAAALRLADEVGYVGAGTAEFLLAPDGSWYFLEMNARIQVEHPVTELVTSIDLVRRQLEIAAGLPLELEQGDVLLRGHAIEARIYAEDADTRLPADLRRACSPCAGRAGPGVRIDAGVDGGDVVGTRYDGLLAKLCVHGETRARALARLRAALDDVVVLGLTTNLPLLRSVASNPEFERGGVDTGWLERTWQPQPAGAAPPEALAAAEAYAASEQGESPWQGRWRAGCAGDAGRRSGGARRRRLPARLAGRARRPRRAERAGRARAARRRAGRAPRRRGAARIVAPMPGAVLRLEVAEGDEVEERAAAARARGDEDGAPGVGALRRARPPPRLPRGTAGGGRRSPAGAGRRDGRGVATTGRPAKLPPEMIGSLRPLPSTASTSMSGAPIMTSRWMPDLFTAAAARARACRRSPAPNAMCAAAFSSSSVVKYGRPAAPTREPLSTSASSPSRPAPAVAREVGGQELAILVGRRPRCARGGRAGTRPRCPRSRDPRCASGRVQRNMPVVAAAPGS